MAMNTITPTSGLDLLVHRGVDRLREVATSPGPETGAPSPMSSLFPRRESSRRSQSRSRSRSRARNGDYSSIDDSPSRLLELPNELQYMIIAHLSSMGDIERLRRTCRFYHQFLSPEFIREHFGDDRLFAWQLRSHCRSCLANPGRSALILQPDTRPISAKCVDCSVRERNLKVGSRLNLANTRAAWVCRWCGFPITTAPSWSHEQFHINCYDRYYRVLWVFMCLGFAQFSAGIAAAALSLVYFRDSLSVFPPTVITFVLLWVCMLFLILRGNYVRTYHWVFFVELVILGLWIPPIYSASKSLSGSTARASTVAALAFFALNALFRLFNCIGNVVLMYEYDMTRHHVPQQTLRRRLLNMLMAGLIYWTYPQCVEQKYPPDYS
ncbi:hypothetical protein F5Y15DRAFT_160240 [Xylariaceae sp. FL0016]|nr:hypothetical protein F5Y15DRAFT_160240 [Xylariaceae sp. FL0016]